MSMGKEKLQHRGNKNMVLDQKNTLLIFLKMAYMYLTNIYLLTINLVKDMGTAGH